MQQRHIPNIKNRSKNGMQNKCDLSQERQKKNRNNKWDA